jgi:hypothetical protein
MDDGGSGSKCWTAFRSDCRDRDDNTATTYRCHKIGKASGQISTRSTAWRLPRVLRAEFNSRGATVMFIETRSYLLRSAEGKDVIVYIKKNPHVNACFVYGINSFASRQNSPISFSRVFCLARRSFGRRTSILSKCLQEQIKRARQRRKVNQSLSFSRKSKQAQNNSKGLFHHSVNPIGGVS